MSTDRQKAFPCAPFRKSANLILPRSVIFDESSTLNLHQKQSQAFENVRPRTSNANVEQISRLHMIKDRLFLRLQNDGADFVVQQDETPPHWTPRSPQIS